MFTLLAASEGAALPTNAVGWVVTVLGVLLALAWGVYVAR